MAVDKNLFLYNLAIATIMKNEAPYVKEWLDYHILAGVEHFYIYDNDSPDNLKEILQPYINAGVVTYIFYPGKARQYEAYNDAIQDYRFLCRYIAFIDADEFIFPQNNKSVIEVVDEIFENKPNAGGLGVNIYRFGSNYLENADYSKGVLERFTRRAPVDWLPVVNAAGVIGGTAHVKTITNPRKVNFFFNPHFAVYFEGFHAINENGGIVPTFSNSPPTVEKIVMNHYPVKSFEEWKNKVNRGTADAYHNIYSLEKFKEDDHNEVFDDSILKYRAVRQLGGHGTIKQINYSQLCSALIQNLFPIFAKNAPQENFAGKMENFLTCRRLAEHVSGNVLDESAGKILEEMALKSIYRTLFTNMDFSDIRLLLAELPNILTRDYPVVNDIRHACMGIIPQMLNAFRIYNANAWKEIVNLKYLLKILQTYDSYEHKN